MHNKEARWKRFQKDLWPVENLEAQKTLSAAIKTQANREGFNPVGIARVPGSKRIQLRTDALQRWLKAGHHADMNWMMAQRRQKIESLLEGVSSVLAVGLNYYVNQKRQPGTLSIARYAWGMDYHKTIEKRLKRIGRWLENQRPTCRWRVCVDASPLLDKAWAEEAGLGWIGKNSNLINTESGSWMVIGHLLCTERLIPDKPSTPLCGQCQECIDKCPTKAISEPFVVNAKRCLAYHTLENRDKTLPNEIRNMIGSWVAGCDICQEVCPWNKEGLESSKDASIQPKEWVLNLTKNEALTWSDEIWSEKLKGSALKRIKPWMWRRNAKLIKDKMIYDKSPS